MLITISETLRKFQEDLNVPFGCVSDGLAVYVKCYLNFS